MKSAKCARSVLIVAVAVISVLLVFALSACDVNGIVGIDGMSDLNYANASAYSVAERVELDAHSTVSEIEVDWINGNIQVEYLESAAAVDFYEVAEGEEVTEDTTMHYLLDNGVLRIKYAKPGKFKNGNLRKKLYINLPRNLTLSKLDIESVNGNINADCNAGKIDIETVNGNINLKGTATRVEVESVNGNNIIECNAGIVNVENVNGSIEVRGTANSVDIETVNGNVTVACKEILRELDVETVSGNVNLNIAEERGFRLEYETISGKMSSSFSGQLTMQGRVYVYLGGGAAIDVETVSGSLSLGTLQ